MTRDPYTEHMDEMLRLGGAHECASDCPMPLPRRRPDFRCPICGISESIPSPDHDHRANFTDPRPIPDRPKSAIALDRLMEVINERTTIEPRHRSAIRASLRAYRRAIESEARASAPEQGEPPAFRGDGFDRWQELARFLRTHGDHDLTRLEADEEFGHHEGFACPQHEAEVSLIPPAASGAQAVPPLDVERLAAALHSMLFSGWPHNLPPCRTCNERAAAIAAEYAGLHPESSRGGE